MKIRVKNVGIINNADIELNNITVVAGENDTGKSTLSKLIYSIIRANNTYEDDYNDFIVRKLINLSAKIYRQLRKSNDFDNIYSEYRELISPRLFEKAVKNNSDDVYKLSRIASDYFERVREYQRILDNYSNRDIMSRYEKELFELMNMMTEYSAKNELIIPSLEKYLGSEFENDISPKYLRVPSNVQVSDGYDNLLEFEIVNNKLSFVNFKERVLFTDVTYIESPYVLNRQCSVSSSDDTREGDLMRKLKQVRNKFDRLYDNSIYNIYANGKMEHLFIDELMHSDNTIGKIIDGNFEYNSDDDEFYYRKGRGGKHKVSNVASGIKAFGILNLLLNNNSLEPGSIVIIDEPEVHLHPTWQVEYGKLICQLSKLDIAFLINSHSPYLIEAINYYSKQFEISDTVNFYLSEKRNGDQSIFIDCTQDLNRIHAKLSEPIERLVWEV